MGVAMTLRNTVALLLASAMGAAAPVHAQSPTPSCERGQLCASGWLEFGAQQRERVFALAEDYKSFMSVARTARTTVREVERRAREAGFKPWRPGEKLTPGTRWYVSNREQALTLFVIGKRSLRDGARLVAAHIDSPHLTLKGRPLYEAQGFALLQTSVHGNILNFQWGNTPLALIGRIGRKDGTFVDLSVGLSPQDPVFMVAGLAPHVDNELRERTYREALAAEELDPIVGSTPLSATEGVRAQVLKYLREQYGVGVDDFVSADLDLVPAGSPRDVGFDRALMTMYGQDDRIGAYAALRGLFGLKVPDRTAVVFLANNEEIGNYNTTGARSDFMTDMLEELLYAELGDALREPLVKRTLRASKVMSIDVHDGLNPIWPNAFELGNAPRVGNGITFKIYGQGANAPPEYAAWLRKAFDEAGVNWQTTSYKSGRVSSGRSHGDEFTVHNMDVIEVGLCVMSLHHTYDLSSKADLWSLTRAVDAFYAAAER